MVKRTVNDSSQNNFGGLNFRKGGITTEGKTNERIGGFFVNAHRGQDVRWFKGPR
jgi:hypothetical protein